MVLKSADREKFLIKETNNLYGLICSNRSISDVIDEYRKLQKTPDRASDIANIQQQIQTSHSLLKRCIKYCDELYYVYGISAITDDEFDQCKKDLEFMHASMPEMFKAEKPIGIGSSLHQFGSDKDFFKRARHTIPMLSLDSKHNEQDVSKFIEKISKDTAEEMPEIMTECKIDGVSMSVRYQEGQFKQALSRGDGEYGEDLTENVRHVPNLPMSLTENLNIEIRGEVYLPMNYQEEFPKKTLRNATCGLLHRQELGAEYGGKLHFIPYNIINAQNYGLSTQEDILFFLRKLGFEPFLQVKKCVNQQDIFDFFENMRSDRENLPFESDGVVCKVNSIALQDKFGFGSNGPKWAIAYKFPPQSAVTKVERIEWQVSRFGKLTPVAILKPVDIAGGTIRKTSLHNYDHLQKLKIYEGAAVLVVRVSDIIPQITKVLYADEGKKPCVIPSECPECKAAVIDQCCTGGLSCRAQLKERIKYFAKSLDIQGLGASQINSLIKYGFVKSLADIFRLHEITNNGEKLAKCPTWGMVSARNLLQAIELRRRISLFTFISSLGIPKIGSVVAQNIADFYGSAHALYQDLTHIDLINSSYGGVGVTARCIEIMAPYAEILRNLEKSIARNDFLNSDRPVLKIIIKKHNPFALLTQEGVTFVLDRYKGIQNKQIAANFITDLVFESLHDFFWANRAQISELIQQLDIIKIKPE